MRALNRSPKFAIRMEKQILIDGYNLLRCSAWPKAGDRDLEGQRDDLVRQLQTYAARNGENIVVVFDNSQGSMKQIHHGSLLKVVFSPASKEADEVIQQMIRKARSARNIIVVSTDRAIRNTAKDHGAISMRSESFCSLLFSKETESSYSTAAEEDKDLSAEEVEYWKRLFEEGGSDD